MLLSLTLGYRLAALSRQWPSLGSQSWPSWVPSAFWPPLSGTAGFRRAGQGLDPGGSQGHSDEYSTQSYPAHFSNELLHFFDLKFLSPWLRFFAQSEMYNWRFFVQFWQQTNNCNVCDDNLSATIQQAVEIVRLRTVLLFCNHNHFQCHSITVTSFKTPKWPVLLWVLVAQKTTFWLVEILW